VIQRLEHCASAVVFESRDTQGFLEAVQSFLPVIAAQESPDLVRLSPVGSPTDDRLMIRSPMQGTRRYLGGQNMLASLMRILRVRAYSQQATEVSSLRLLLTTHKRTTRRGILSMVTNTIGQASIASLCSVLVCRGVLRRTASLRTLPLRFQTFHSRTSVLPCRQSL